MKRMDKDKLKFSLHKDLENKCYQISCVIYTTFFPSNEYEVGTLWKMNSQINAWTFCRKDPILSVNLSSILTSIALSPLCM
uniref:Uncharacterized protein n=1 Tax=Oryza punctata TaxID=4537 RepID=A0A0E0K5Y1_ORYPU